MDNLEELKQKAESGLKHLDQANGRTISLGDMVRYIAALEAKLAEMEGQPDLSGMNLETGEIPGFRLSSDLITHIKNSQTRVNNWSKSQRDAFNATPNPTNSGGTGMTTEELKLLAPLVGGNLQHQWWLYWGERNQFSINLTRTLWNYGNECFDLKQRLIGNGFEVTVISNSHGHWADATDISNGQTFDSDDLGLPTELEAIIRLFIEVMK